MHPHLDTFFRLYIGVVLSALVPVLLTAFLTVPFNLGRHPGEQPSQPTDISRHMT